jgi:ubiquinone/menaquinone biosynthesis C-methylase UbiE
MHSSHENSFPSDNTRFHETADIETASRDYARRFSGKVGEWFLSVQEMATLRMLANHGHAEVLDVGGGHGQLTEGLVKNRYSVTVLGSSSACSPKLQEYVQAGLCELRVGDLLDMPFPDRSFDIVLSFRLLPHVFKWQRFLQELARVADEAVIFDYPELHSWNLLTPFFFKMKKRLEGNTRPYTSFRTQELVEQMAQQGFYLEDRFAQFFLPMVFHRRLKSPGISDFFETGFRKLGLTRSFGSPVIIKFKRGR